MSAEFWVGVGFFIFIGILAYAGVHKTLLKGIDARAVRISAELHEAQRLRMEAEKLLAEYEAKRVAAEKEATAIVAEAEAEAKRIASEAEASVDQFVKRRTQQAETRIAQAEQAATSEVRAAAADAAIRAAEIILKGQMAGEAANAMLTAGLADVKAKLN